MRVAQATPRTLVDGKIVPRPSRGCTGTKSILFCGGTLQICSKCCASHTDWQTALKYVNLATPSNDGVARFTYFKAVCQSVWPRQHIYGFLEGKIVSRLHNNNEKDYKHMIPSEGRPERVRNYMVVAWAKRLHKYMWAVDVWWWWWWWRRRRRWSRWWWWWWWRCFNFL